MAINTKKSTYLAPQCEVVEIDLEQSFLTGSSTAEDVTDVPGSWG